MLWPIFLSRCSALSKTVVLGTKRLLLAAALLSGAVRVYAVRVSVIEPDDPIIASSSNSPLAEQVTNVIDTFLTTKYLNFDKLNTYIQITPSAGPTVVTEMALYTANDEPERDPASFILSGSKDHGQTFTEISRGAIPGTLDRYQKQEFHFSNDQAYSIYRITFPTVQGTSANSIQLSELQLYTQLYTVTSDLDSGPGTLRAALEANNGTLGGGVIRFNLPSHDVIYLNSPLTVGKQAIIKGPGVGQLTISGNLASPLFHLSEEALTVEALTLADGSNPVFDGGAILTESGTSLTLRDCTLINSRASSGGGIKNQGRLLLDHCTLSGNSATAEGGAIANSDGTVDIANSTLSDNTAGSNGGAIRNFGGTVTLTNSTLSGNSSEYGGAVANSDTLILTNSTLSGNSASAGGGNLYSVAGELNVPLKTQLHTTIVDGNGPSANCTGPITSKGYNLSSDGSCFNPTATPTDRIHANPRLGPLQDNGGSTLTQLLLPGSPAIDAGDATGIKLSDTDQRGFVRIRGLKPDIGAVEAPLFGDIDGNGKFDATDLQGVMRIFIGKDSVNDAILEYIDVMPVPGAGSRLYGDGGVGGDDLNWLLRKYLGIKTLP